jgi:hypothetical protein
MVDGSARTVTFLFTDIESSTDRWEADSEAMAALLISMLSLVGEYDVIRELLAERSAAGLRCWADAAVEADLLLREGRSIDDLLAELRPIGEIGRSLVNFAT